ncbi:MAG: DUF6691 family protein [Balneolales bacterium]
MKFIDYILYLISGIFFGFVLVKSEVVSWFRIQEMFRFDSIHMYGIIGLAILVGMISIQIIKKINAADKDGNLITISPKDPTQWKSYIIGGSLFGFGWALLGACPAPLFALLGTGISVMIVPIIAAIAGTYTYGIFRNYLPH